MILYLFKIYFFLGLFVFKALMVLCFLANGLHSSYFTFQMFFWFSFLFLDEHSFFNYLILYFLSHFILSFCKRIIGNCCLLNGF